MWPRWRWRNRAGPTGPYLDIGDHKIYGYMGTSISFGDPITSSTWNGNSITASYGGTGSTSSTSYAQQNGATDFQIADNNGGVMLDITTGDSASGGVHPQVSAGGGSTVFYTGTGSTLQLNASTSGAGTLSIGVTNSDTVNLGGKTTFEGPAVMKGYTVSTLPSSPGTGARAYVTDATSCSFLGSLAGGGSTFCPVIYNGSAWVGG
jgi:hypothetical protein